MIENFDPITDIKNSHLILDNGLWPNFHDAEVHQLNIWRGDVRPDDDVWIGPVVDASFELCALKEPYRVALRFNDCDNIRMESFNHQNAVYDLEFKLEPRGYYNNGEPLPPYIMVSFQQAFGVALSFRCFKIQAIEPEMLRHDQAT